MALQSSGQISFSDIASELSLTGTLIMAGSSIPVGSSLFGAAQSSLNKTAPHKISEFYGYTHLGGGPPPPPGGGGGGGGGGGLGGP
jgi:hypothetical protein